VFHHSQLNHHMLLLVLEQASQHFLADGSEPHA
jgi:hypothetical protein